MTQLPKPFHGFYGVPMFGADQMRAHEAAVRAEERERAAMIVQENAECCRGPIRSILLANAAAIRAMENG